MECLKECLNEDAKKNDTFFVDGQPPILLLKPSH